MKVQLKKSLEYDAIRVEDALLALRGGEATAPTWLAEAYRRCNVLPLFGLRQIRVRRATERDTVEVPLDWWITCSPNGSLGTCDDECFTAEFEAVDEEAQSAGARTAERSGGPPSRPPWASSFYQGFTTNTKPASPTDPPLPVVEVRRLPDGRARLMVNSYGCADWPSAPDAAPDAYALEVASCLRTALAKAPRQGRADWPLVEEAQPTGASEPKGLPKMIARMLRRKGVVVVPEPAAPIASPASPPASPPPPPPPSPTHADQGVHARYAVLRLNGRTWATTTPITYAFAASLADRWNNEEQDLPEAARGAYTAELYLTHGVFNVVLDRWEPGWFLSRDEATRRADAINATAAVELAQAGKAAVVVAEARPRPICGRCGGPATRRDLVGATSYGCDAYPQCPEMVIKP